MVFAGKNIFIILFLFFMSLGYEVNAQDTLFPKLIVSTSDYFPYNSLNQDGKVVGINADKVRAFLDETGLNYEFQIRPFSRGYRETMMSNNTLIFSLKRTPERENNFHWIFQVSSDKNYLMTLNNESLKNLSREEVIAGDGMAICKTLSWQCKALEDYGFPKARILTLSEAKMADIPRLVLRGRAEFFISDYTTLSIGAEHIGRNVEDFAEFAFISDASGYLAGSKKLDPHLLKRLMSKSSLRN